MPGIQGAARWWGAAFRSGSWQHGLGCVFPLCNLDVTLFSQPSKSLSSHGYHQKPPSLKATSSIPLPPGKMGLNQHRCMSENLLTHKSLISFHSGQGAAEGSPGGHVRPAPSLKELSLVGERGQEAHTRCRVMAMRMWAAVTSQSSVPNA